MAAGSGLGTRLVSYRVRFNLREVYISRICNFRVFKFAGAGYSGVEIFAGEIFADVFRHVVLVPVGVPMLAQEVFHRFIIPFSFWLANSAQYVFFRPLTVLSFNSKPCFVFKSREAAAMPFSAVYVLGDLCFLSLCGGLVILVFFHRPHGHRSALQQLQPRA